MKGPWIRSALVLASVFVVAGSVVQASAREMALENAAMVREFESMVQDEIAQMEYWLQLATGEEVPCDDACIRHTDLHDIMEGLKIRCQKVDPSVQFSAPGYALSQNKAALTALSDACEVIVNQGGAATRSTSSQPDLREVATRAREILESVEGGL